MEEKRFDEWNIVKSKLHKNGKLPSIKEREVWWCSVGENIGTEINGKKERFNRPVLVFRKLSRFGFIGIPLTSKNKDKFPEWYAKFTFKDTTEWAALCQIRYFSASRVHNKMGSISKSDFQTISEALNGLLNKK